MLRSLRILLCAAPVLALVPLLTPTTTRALPLWSRQYGVACVHCHAPFPRLNAVGARFRQNGYRMPDEPGRAITEVREFPLAVVANLGYAFTSTASRVGTGPRVRRDLGGFEANAVEVHSAGTLAERTSFHFGGDLAHDTSLLEGGVAFVQFDDLAGAGALNLRVGVFGGEVPYLSRSLRTTLHDYLTPVTLDARGLELNGVRGGWTWAAGLIDSRRSAPPARKTFNRLEDTYLWLMRDVGGEKVAARVLFDRQDSNLAKHEWLQHLQVGLSARLGSDRFAVIPGYLLDRFDDRPGIGIHDKHHLELLEAVLSLGRERRWVITARGELEYRTPTALTPEENRQLEALNVAHLVHPDLEVAVEWAHASDNVGGPRVDALNAYLHAGY